MNVHMSPEFSVGDILQATGGTLIGGVTDEPFRGITTDSRTILRGNLFVALHGGNLDGHAYLDQAVEKGASGLLVHRSDGKNRGSIATILVKDTLTALGDIAHAWRQRFSVPVIAITGSSGKTTTKEMVTGILNQTKKVLHSHGNYNNLIGLPLTLFRLNEHHDIVVLELGTNRPGEIARLTQIAKPDIAVVTNVGPAHLEGFGSLEGVGQEKGDIFRYMPQGGTAVLNLDDEYIRRFRIDEANRCVTFGFTSEADISAANIQSAGSNGIRFTLKIKESTCGVNLSVAGKHNIANALAAAALAWVAGSTTNQILHGLEAFKPVPGRMEIIPLKNGAFVINDTYNANPESVREALYTLQTLKMQGQSIAILGDMLELGHEAEVRHRDMGGLLADTGVKWVYLRGRLSQATAAGALNKGMAEEQIFHFTDPSEILDHLLARMTAGDWVLIKGSRGMKMEEMVDKLSTVIGRKGGNKPLPQEGQA